MSKKIRMTVAKAAGAMAVAFVATTGATHLMGANSSAQFVAQDMAVVISPGGMQSAPMVAQATVSILPADALIPGKTLALVPETVPEPQPIAEPELASIEPAPDCTVTFDARLMEGAMVRLIALAPCDPAARFTIHHEDLTFDVVADANGALSVDVPALAPIAMFTADVNGETLRTIAAIPDFEAYERVALKWQGQTGLQIHALEFGADYGTDGHVWADQPGTAQRAVRARGGFITRLGDTTLVDGHAGEIYVFPAGMMQRAGTVRLSVEAEVNALTCGTSVNAHALQPDADGRLQTTALTLEIPECDAVGDILVLKNLLRDMKIASN